MKPFSLGKLYLGVSINRKPEYVHRIVASTYISNQYNKTDVNHINGNKFDNRVENLEWTTHKENIKHSFDKLGRKQIPLTDERKEKLLAGRIKNKNNG
jgi:hypothetical protein